MPAPPARSGTAALGERLAVVGTAGHIDHGKTALVRRLTGVDTDRLPEEKQRGISIDLGFAPLVTPAGIRVGIVDVPGHERFVKNMLAGAGGIDLVLLVIAADEGVMPQTREHFAIVKLLGVTRGIVVLTKSDLVEREWLDLAKRDVQALLAGTPLASAPIVEFSAVTGQGTSELLAELDRQLAAIANRPSAEPARLPVDRVFSVEGFGTVVTGTLWRGAIRTGDNLALLPAGRETRVRRVQVHGLTVDEARAGQRTAVAIHGIEREAVVRGDWLVAPGSLRASSVLDVRFELLSDYPRAWASNQRVRFHLGASEIIGRLVLLEGEQIGAQGESRGREEAANAARSASANAASAAAGTAAHRNPGAPAHGTRTSPAQGANASLGTGARTPPADVARTAPAGGTRLALRPGASALAQLRLEKPTVAARGDRFVIRSYSPSRTVGGGVVIEPVAEKRRRQAAGIEQLAVYESGSIEARLLQRLDREQRPVAAAHLSQLLSEREAEVEAALEKLRASGLAVSPLSGRWVSNTRWSAARLAIERDVRAFADRHPARFGIAKGDLKSALRATIDAALFDAAYESLVADRTLEHRAERVRPAGMPWEPPAEAMRALEALEAELEASGMSVPENAAWQAKLGAAAAEVMTLGLFLGRLVRVSQELTYTVRQMESLRAKLVAHFDKAATLQVAAFKDLAGVSRKYAVPLLEHGDRVGWTVRAGDERKRGGRLG